ncbi:unnamed protein product [Meloidogyne enterolobii]|uniref:Uncharacterized protein n=1 Tax=Meloidogyne enterolobii TaxID=390850 RepID=A0ACB0YM13_MELEN
MTQKPPNFQSPLLHPLLKIFQTGLEKLENSINELVPNDDERKPLVDGSNENQGSDHGCFEGWLNYRNELCFYGSQIAGSFFEGREQCGLLNANFTSVHSLREFKFITDNFDLKEYWIGIVYGSPNFEDGTEVTILYVYEIDMRTGLAATRGRAVSTMKDGCHKPRRITYFFLWTALDGEWI